VSPLTKLFVVLLVVLSLLQTAAVVVYVNKEDSLRQSAIQMEERLRARETELTQAREAMTAAQQNLVLVQQESNARSNQAAKDIINAQQQAADLSVQLAKAASANAAQQLDISRLTEGLKASQDTTSRLTTEVARLRGTNDQLVRQTSELNASVSDLSNRLDVTERERKVLAEQLTEAQTNSQRLGGLLQQNNISPNQGGAVPGTPRAPVTAPPITGVVQEVKTIANMPYATISVGSADQVAPGMEFKIINKNTGDYLGSMVVDSVTPNQATGKITGPKVGDIRPGVEVRTQL
jgi:hypothetical protein